MRRPHNVCGVFSCAALMFVGVALAQAGVRMSLTTVRVAAGLSRPVFVTGAPGDFTRLYIVQQRGLIRILNLQTGALNAQPFLDLTALVSQTGNERGLLGMGFHPDHQNNGFFYVYYTASAGGATVVARYTRFTPDAADSSSANPVMTYSQPQSNHNGGWIGFGPDGFLYIASGDGGSGNDTGSGHTEPGGNAQDITNNLLGKMLRIDVTGDDFPADSTRNYAVPASNPFVGVTGDDEIWAFGLRNPWRDSFDRLTGRLYIGDVGQGAIEEIDVQAATSAGGENYGWRCMEGNNCTGLSGCTCLDAALTDPIHTYTHGGGRCSITGGYVYRGCFIEGLGGTYFFADHCSNNIWSFLFTGAANPAVTDRTADLAPGGGLSIASISSFGEDTAGELYICDLNGGEVFKIVPDCPRGDIDGDCDEDAADVTAFVNVLFGLDTDCGRVARSDFNSDGLADGDDIPGMVDALIP